MMGNLRLWGECVLECLHSVSRHGDDDYEASSSYILLSLYIVYHWFDSDLASWPLSMFLCLSLSAVSLCYSLFIHLSLPICQFVHSANQITTPCATLFQFITTHPRRAFPSRINEDLFSSKSLTSKIKAPERGIRSPMCFTLQSWGTQCYRSLST